jgi:hypothetical protein
LAPATQSLRTAHGDDCRHVARIGAPPRQPNARLAIAIRDWPRVHVGTADAEILEPVQRNLVRLVEVAQVDHDLSAQHALHLS